MGNPPQTASKHQPTWKCNLWQAVRDPLALRQSSLVRCWQCSRIALAPPSVRNLSRVAASFALGLARISARGSASLRTGVADLFQFQAAMNS